MCAIIVDVVLVVRPSPKSQNRFVIVPVELSVKLTVTGQKPLVGLAWKLASGIVAPVPITLFVEIPALVVRKTTLLLKTPFATGANWITTLVEVWPDRLNELPAAVLKTLSTVTTALLRVTSPRFVATKLVWALAPTAIVPKSKAAGETASCAGASPVPLTALVELPALAVVKTRLLLKTPAATGANWITTLVEL